MDNPQPTITIRSPEIWILNVDGSAGEQNKGAGFILEDPQGQQYAYTMKFLFLVCNNKVGYEALLARLKMAKNLKFTQLLVRSDSQVVFGHLTGIFEAQEDNMQTYLLCVQQMLFEFSNVQFEKVPREQNIKADMLCKISAGEYIKGTWLESLSEKKNIGKDVCTVDETEDWQLPFGNLFYMKNFPMTLRKQEDTHHLYLICLSG